jgi:hypothetical protein
VSDRPQVILDPSDEDEAAPAHSAPAPAPETSVPPAPSVLPRIGDQSVLDSIRAGFDDEREDERDDTRVYKVGKTVPGLYCRYRPLLDDEREAVDRKIRERVKLLKRVGQYDEGEAKIEEAALVLSKACVELAWDVEGEKLPLHEVLELDGPALRFDRRAADALGLADIARFAAAESGADVAAAMHYWAGNHGPLLSTYGLYKVWSQGIDVEDLSEAMEGS